MAATYHCVADELGVAPRRQFGHMFLPAPSVMARDEQALRYLLKEENTAVLSWRG